MTSRKHYEEAALAIFRIERAEERRRVAEDFARIFRADNPRFDTARFLEACGARPAAFCPISGEAY